MMASATWPRRMALATLAAAVAATLAFALFVTRSPHFEHHAERLLSTVATSTAVRVQLVSTSGLAAHGVLLPRQNGSQLHFDGRVTYEYEGHEYNFTLLDGRGFATIQDITTGAIQSDRCLEKNEVPPLFRLADALRSARVVDEASAVDCTDGKVVEFVFAGEPFAFCSHPSGSVDQIHGEDLNVTLQVGQDGAAEELSIYRTNISECERLDDALMSQTTASGSLSRVVDRAEDAMKLMSGKRRLLSFNDCDVKCRDGKKICLFVHGLGKTLDAPIADSYPQAWGDPSQLNCCSQTKFMRMDTVNNPWYGDALSKKVCDAAVAITGSKDRMQLENIAIISHSMGNLIVANAAVKGLCAVGPRSKWITLAGPMSGSKSANLGVKTCGALASKVSESVFNTLSALRFCPAKSTMSSLVYESSELSNQQLNDMYEKAHAAMTKYATSSMCGVSAYGITSIDSAKFYALGLISGHGSEHDGAVEINSCTRPFGRERYSDSWKDGNFYMAAINHGDASLRHGNGLIGSNRKPLKWLNCQF